MKKIRFISFCLVLIIVLSGFSACANPPGTKSPLKNISESNDKPSVDSGSASDIKEPGFSKPVDLSILNETELHKIKDDLLNVLKTSGNTDEILIAIFFTETEEEKNIDTVINEKMAEKEERSAEIEAELREIQKEYDSLSSAKDEKSKKRAEELSQRMTELGDELETYSMEYTQLRLQMKKEINEPIVISFAERHDIDLSSADDVNYVVSTIFGIELPAEKIVELAKDDAVGFMDILVRDSEVEFDEEAGLPSRETVFSSSDHVTLDNTKVNEIYNIIDGEKSVNSGYSGSGVVVGMVDMGVPDQSVISNLQYYVYHSGAVAGPVDDHATNVAKIIKKMVPDCQIIAIDIPGWSCTSLYNLLEDNPTIDVVCLTTGEYSNDGKYTASTEYIDEIANDHKIPIVVAVGNSGGYVSQQALCPNVIAAGAVKHYGSNASASGAFSTSSVSSYREYPGNIESGKISMVNKPDVCAPGDVATNSVIGYTSYSTPYVVGAISQMMSRNIAYKTTSLTRHCDLMAKASMMVSCFYNAGTTMEQINSGDYAIYELPAASNKEGAGVINAGACYNMACAYQYENYTLTSFGTTTEGIVVYDTTKPLRVAVAWRTEMVSDEESFNNSNIMLHVYKEGSAQAIARSSALGFLQETVSGQKGPVTNYQYVEIPASTLAAKGSGNYIIKVIFNSTQNEVVSVPVSLAWAQY